MKDNEEKEGEKERREEKTSRARNYLFFSIA
jgi:hypothetical protein